MSGARTGPLETHFFGPVAAVRPAIALKGTLLLLAFDIWRTRVAHGARYGAGGFNVPHFEWLDALPTPSPGLYVGLSVATGVAAFALAFASHPPRALLAGLTLATTYGWAMSMLDSFQHHYLLSLVLAAMVFFPRARPGDREAGPLEPAAAPQEGSRRRGQKRRGKKKKRREAAAPEASSRRRGATATVAAPAYVTLGATVAIVYAYTAYSKTDPAWLAGDAFRRVLRGRADALAPLEAMLPGFEGPAFWWLMGHGVVLVQMICAAGYLLAPALDRDPPRALSVFRWIALATALSFHVGAEWLELKIGWFSYYMIFYALVFLLPAPWLEAIFARLGAPARALAADLGPRLASLPKWSATLLAVAAGAIAVGAGVGVDLPGVTEGMAVLAGLLLVGALTWASAGARWREPARLAPYALGLALGGLAMWGAIATSEVRWDFYRNMGGDHRRRGELEVALHAYEQANRYAPAGESREQQEREIRALLEAREMDR